MENKEIAIQLSGVKKMYKLGQIGGGTLQGDLQSWWARVRGKEDPNTKIGTDQRLIGQTFIGYYWQQRRRQEHHAEAPEPGYCAH